MTEIADGNILPIDGFGTIEVTWTNRVILQLVKIGAVTYAPGLSRNLLFTLKAVEQWAKSLIYYRITAVSGLPEKESLVFNFYSRKGLFSATGVRRISSQVVALRASITEAGPARTGCKDSTGGGSESTQHNGGKLHAGASERGHDAENGRESRRRASGGPARRACR